MPKVAKARTKRTKIADVYRRGEGSGGLVMHEIPGITPRVEEFAARVVDEGRLRAWLS